MEPSALLGIFDSGVGGFSVYRKIKEASSVNTLYYGDCERAPYGNREDLEIVEFNELPRSKLTRYPLSV
jgi:glutamate racemase